MGTSNSLFRKIADSWSSHILLVCAFIFLISGYLVMKLEFFCLHCVCEFVGENFYKSSSGCDILLNSFSADRLVVSSSLVTNCCRLSFIIYFLLVIHWCSSPSSHRVRCLKLPIILGIFNSTANSERLEGTIFGFPDRKHHSIPSTQFMKNKLDINHLL